MKSRRSEQYWSIEDYQRMPSSTHLALGALAAKEARTIIFNCLSTIFPIAKFKKIWTKVACGMKTTYWFSPHVCRWYQNWSTTEGVHSLCIFQQHIPANIATSIGPRALFYRASSRG